MSLVSALRGKGKSGFGYGSTAEQVTEGLDLSGKSYLITGCNSGVGQESARVLALRGATVIGTGRTLAKAEAACAPLGALARGLECELSEPSSIRACIKVLVDEQITLHGIICNAGIMALPELTLKHGYELQFLTNHMGHFMLVNGLLPQLHAQGRVVAVSSEAHRSAPRGGIQFDNLAGQKRYSGWTFYGQSKLANILFIRQLAKRMRGTEQVAHAVHPGVIATQLARSMNPLVDMLYKVASPIALKSIPEGAATQVYAATHPGLTQTEDAYLADCNPKKGSRYARDAALPERLWSESERIAAELMN